jgi:penicillin G amidase
MADRRVGHLVNLIRSQEEGWFAQSWPETIVDAIRKVVSELRSQHGPGPDYWQWGDLRQLHLEHAIFGNHWLKRIFQVGPIPMGGDGNTVFQASCRPLDPWENPQSIPNLRVVFDTSDWSNSRFVLAGGQSGNPLSENYRDQFELWQRGESFAIAWTPEEVLRTAVASLRLLPG